MSPKREEDPNGIADRPTKEQVHCDCIATFLVVFGCTGEGIELSVSL